MSQFDPNPYSSPNVPGTPPGPHDRQAALDKVKIPAIILMVLGPICIVVFLVDFGFRMMNLISGEAAPVIVDPNQAAGFQAGAVGGAVVEVIAILCQIFVIFGAYQMMNLKSLMLAKTAAIISVIPCLSACCVLGIPFGIWSLVVLNDPSVRSQFTS